jgi:hypothetical protein
MHASFARINGACSSHVNIRHFVHFPQGCMIKCSTNNVHNQVGFTKMCAQLLSRPCLCMMIGWREAKRATPKPVSHCLRPRQQRHVLSAKRWVGNTDVQRRVFWQTLLSPCIVMLCYVCQQCVNQACKEWMGILFVHVCVCELCQNIREVVYTLHGHLLLLLLLLLSSPQTASTLII